MEFKILLDNKEELLSVDAGWINGYFEISENDFSIILFKDRKCMVMLTLSAMCDFLSNQQRKKFWWVGEDNGKFFIVKRQKDTITLTSKEFNLTFNSKDFTESFKKSTSEFISLCRASNSKIDEESGFLTLEMSFNQL